jgi:hypothetical protein
VFTTDPVLVFKPPRICHDDDPATSELHPGHHPATNKWTALPASPLPGREGPAAVWTGRQMMVWGGYTDSRSYTDGAVYTPGKA